MLHVEMIEPPLNVKEQFGSSTKWNSEFVARAHVQGFLKHSLRALELKHLASLILTIQSLGGLPRAGQV